MLQSCVSCLGVIVNDVTRNFKLVKDLFQKFFGVLSAMRQRHQRDPSDPKLVPMQATCLRALFTLGLLCRHFDFDSEDFGAHVVIKNTVFELLMYFMRHEQDEVRHMALSGLGFFSTRHYEFMIRNELRGLYTRILNDRQLPVRTRTQVLRNLNHYLTEEEMRMIKAEEDCELPPRSHYTNNEVFLKTHLTFLQTRSKIKEKMKT